MSVRLAVTGQVAAPVPLVWSELIDWEGQRRWIPFTTVEVDSARRAGLGTRISALSGVRLGRLPVGLLDRFVVTGWTPPDGDGTAELEVLHLGPYFTGPGVFRLEPSERGTTISCVELFDLPGAPVTEAITRVTLPILRAGFQHALRRLARVCERPSP